ETIDPAAAEEVLALHRTYLRQMSGVATEPTDDQADADLPAADEELGPTDGTDDAAMSDRPESRWPDDEPEDAATASAVAPDTGGEESRAPAGRPSVRSAPLSPRGGAANPEPE